MTGDLGRVDGSLGLALTNPRLTITVSPATTLTTNMFPELARLALERLNNHYGLHKGLSIEVLESYPQHVGLGSTTQILLSIGAAYNALYDRNATVRELARIVGRGGTSGIGVAAFETGGFILDAGHSFGPGKDKERFLPSSESTAPPPPVLFRTDLPDDWVFDVIIPESSSGLFGKAELDFFQHNCPVAPRETCHIAHVVLSSILPGAVDRDIATFARGINLLATLGFKRKETDRQEQWLKQLIETLGNLTAGSAAVGISSFGPTLFIMGERKARRQYIREVAASLHDEKLLRGAAHYQASCRNTGANVLAM